MAIQTNYKYALSAILACVRQEKVSIPEDLTVDNDATIPIRVITVKQQTQNLDFNDQGKSPTYAMLTAKGYKVDAVYARFDLPAQQGIRSIDEVCYDSLPGINILSSFQTGLSSGFAFESINALAIRSRLIDFYGIEIFKQMAIQWLGGYKDNTYTGEYQKMQKMPRSDVKKTIIPAIKITLPLPSCLFFNKEKFCYALCMDAALEFKFTFYPISRVLNYNKNYTPTPLSGTIEIYMRILNPTEYHSFWTGITYTNPSNPNPYYFVDRYFEYQTKTFSISQELKLQVKPAPTTKIHGFICPRHWSQNEVFFGHTVEEASKNYIASMLTHTQKGTNSHFTINLGTGQFPNNSNTIGTLTVANWSETATSFNLIFQRNASSTSVLKISCSLPFGQIGNLYFDLATYAPLSSPNAAGSLDMFQVSSIFFVGSFHLNIQRNDPNLYIELPEYSYEGAKKLYNGLYTYNPAPNSSDNQLALLGVENVTPSPYLNPSDFAFAYLFSLRAPTQNSANILVSQNFKHINKTNHVYYDLDGIWPIKIDSIAYEKTTSNTEWLPNDELDFNQELFKKKHYWSPSIELLYEYCDMFDQTKKSLGNLDLRANDIMYLNFKLQTSQIYYGDLMLIDTLKDYSNRQLEIEVHMLQFGLRMLKYYKGSLDVMTDEERLESNNFIMAEILIPNKLYEPPQLDALNPPVSRNTLTSKRNYSAIRDISPNRYAYTSKPINTLQATSKRPKYF